MRSLLNTLYVTTQGSYLSRDGETVLVRVEKETKLRVPIHTLGGIVCFGQVSCSPPLMELCGERNVAISFLSEQGKFLREGSGAGFGQRLAATRTISPRGRSKYFRRCRPNDGHGKSRELPGSSYCARQGTILIPTMRQQSKQRRHDSDI